MRLFKLLTLAILSLLAEVALATTPTTLPVQGNVGAITGGSTPYAVASIQLANCTSPISIPGYSVIVQTGYQLQANASGVINSTVWPNDLIDCNGTTGNSEYELTYIVNGVPSGPTQCYQVTSTQGMWNLNSQQPIACSQTPPNPQDAQFQNLNILGCLSIDGSGCFGPGPYLPLSGGTLTGPLNGTSATFSGSLQGTTLTDGTASLNAGSLTGAVNGAFSRNLTAGSASVGGVPVSPANLFSGNKSGANPFETATVNSAADTGSTDRHFFDMQDSSGWLQSGTSPIFSNGVWNSSASSASYLVRAFDWSASQCNYTVQGYLYYLSAGVGNYIGVTPSGTSSGALTTPYFAVGFDAGNFGFNTPSGGWTTLVSSAGLVNGSWYLVSLIGVCSADGTASTIVVSYNRPGTITGGTWIEGSAPTATNNMVAESDSANDIQFGLRYAAGRITQPSTTVTPSTNAYQTINIPHSETAKMSPWAFTFVVNSNPAGSFVNTYAYIPTNYGATKQAPWVFYSHGSGQSAATALFTGNEAQVIKALVDAGYVVISTDESAGSLQCWGNSNCVADIGYAVQAYQAALNLAARPYVICESMGGVVCLNAISHGTLPKPLAIADIYPTYNLSNNYTYNGAIATQLNAAYACSSLVTCQAAWAGYDPSSVAISTFASVPLDVWCSAADTVVQCSANGQALANAVNAAGGTATYNATSGDHGNASNFNPAAVVAFFNTH